jgi:hypothetical protein
MALSQMQVELITKPRNIVDGVRYTWFCLWHLLSTFRTLCRDGDAVLVISHLHLWPTSLHIYRVYSVSLQFRLRRS